MPQGSAQFYQLKRIKIQKADTDFYISTGFIFILFSFINFTALFAKVSGDGFHAAALLNVERAAPVAVAAADAVRRVLFQLGIVVCRHAVADNCQVVVFVDKADV